MMDLLKTYAPWLLGLAVVIVFGMFLLLRKDAVKAGEEFPTKLAVAQTISAIRGLLKLRRAVREDDAPVDRRVRTSEELKATITPGSLSTDDVRQMIPKRRKSLGEEGE
jgi:hypothetical protein